MYTVSLDPERSNFELQDLPKIDERHGSIAKKISDNTTKKSLISILGGGDTLSAINKSNNKFTFTHLSTAGGAFLEFLEGKDLPGLNVLK